MEDFAPLTRLAGNGCSNGISCPTIYALDEDTVVVQGYTDRAGDELAVPAGEAVVAIPTAVLVAAAERLRALA